MTFYTAVRLDSNMLLTKTPAGRHMLLNGGLPLTDAACRILALVNGTRNLSEIYALAGLNARYLVEQMIAQGLLAKTSVFNSALIPDPSSVQWLPTQDVIPECSPEVAELSEPIQVSAAALPARAASVVSVSKAKGNRSVAATKMYVIDMLRLVPGRDGAGYVTAVQDSVGEREMMQHVLSAMRYITHKATPSYASKVIAHLQEVIPVEYLEQLDAMIFQALMADGECGGNPVKNRLFAPVPD